MPRARKGGEIGGEHVPTAGNLGPVSSTMESSFPGSPATFEIPGFTAQQISSLKELIEDTLGTSLEDLRIELQYPTQSNQPVQNPPKPSEQALLPQQSFVLQQSQPITKQQEQQAIAEKTAEKTTESISGIASSKANNKSTISTIPSQSAIRISGESTQCSTHCNKQLCRKWAPYSGFLATFLASSLTSFGFLTTSFLALLFGRLLGYMRCTEEMDATGQG